jgi:D-amino-acid dehydrogenase
MTDRPGRVVIAAGAWSAPLARGLGARLPVTSGRGYAIDLDPAPGHPGRVVQLIEASMAIAPLGDRLRLCGTMELARPAAAIDRRRIELMLRSPGRYFDGWAPPEDPPRVVAAPRPMTPDGLPIIGVLERAPEVIVATGHGMLGMTLGAVTGELVAELAAEGRDRIPPAFRPSRFRW